MAVIRFRSLVFALPLLASGAADIAHSVQGVDQAGTGVFASNRVYSAGLHERRYVQTADGSVIWLNAGASIIVCFTTEVRSVVLLSGEALFIVKHDSRHPFRVFSGRSVAEDVGTVFEVTKKPTSTTFLVAEGEIAVFDSAHLGLESSRKAVPNYDEVPQYRRGDQVEISDESGAQLRHSYLADDNLSNALAWKDGRVRFAQTPLDEAVAEFNHYSQIKIELAPDVQQLGLRVSGSFVFDDADAFAAGMMHEWALHARESAGSEGNRVIVLTSEPGGRHSKRN